MDAMNNELTDVKLISKNQNDIDYKGDSKQEMASDTYFRKYVFTIKYVDRKYNYFIVTDDDGNDYKVSNAAYNRYKVYIGNKWDLALVEQYNKIQLSGHVYEYTNPNTKVTTYRIKDIDPDKSVLMERKNK